VDLSPPRRPRCSTASWWRSIKISAVFQHLLAPRQPQPRGDPGNRRNTKRRHMIGDHYGRTAKEQSCWSEPWTRFGTHTASTAWRLRVAASRKFSQVSSHRQRAGASGPARQQHRLASAGILATSQSVLGGLRRSSAGGCWCSSTSPAKLRNACRAADRAG
jgi:hypothetical protein